jgi:hypothetical protein
MIDMTPVSETINTSGLPESYVSLLNTEIDKIPNSEIFKGIYLICVENEERGKMLTDFDGIALTLGILEEKPTAKIILCSIMPLDYLCRNASRINIALRYENVRFIEIPFMPTDEIFAKIFDKPGNYDPKGYNMDQYIQQTVGSIFHSLEGIPNWSFDDLEHHNNHRFKSAIKKTRESFLHLKNSEMEEVIDFLKSLPRSRAEVMAGEELSGVYCDIEGTLLVQGAVNENTLSLLKEYEQQGKEISLWTDGDVDLLQSELDILGVKYPLKSKYDYAGATAEIVIDDKNEKVFTAQTRISAHKYIRVS